MILIVAVNENHFNHFCREVNLPRDKSIVRYVYHSDLLRGCAGRKDLSILLLPQWYLNKTSEEVNKIESLVNEHWSRLRGGAG